MPLTKKGAEILANMQREYGAEKGKRVFYASANKGTIKGVHGRPRKKKTTLGSLGRSQSVNE